MSKYFRLSVSDECSPDGLQSLLGAELSKRGKILNARTAVTMAHNSKREGVFEKLLFPTILKLAVVADSTLLSGREARQDDQPDTLLVPLCSQRLQQVVVMLLQNGARWILDFVKLEDGEANFLASVDVRVKRANGSRRRSRQKSVGQRRMQP